LGLSGNIKEVIPKIGGFNQNNQKNGNKDAVTLVKLKSQGFHAKAAKETAQRTQSFKRFHPFLGVLCHFLYCFA